MQAKEVGVMMFGYGGWAAWEIALMWISVIAFTGLLIWALYALITNATRGAAPRGGGADPCRILDERLARGEIDTAEYQRLRGLITPVGHTTAGSGSGR